MRLTVTTFVTLDGVVQGPGAPHEDTSGGFTRGGWVVPYVMDDADFGAIIEEVFGKADAFLLGRTTYDLFSSYWPLVTDEQDPVAGPLNKLPKHVVTSRPLTGDWAGTSVVSGDVPAAVARLKEEPGDELQVHGSGLLTQALLAHGLVDEYRLIVFPVVLGEGKRLFADVREPVKMRLTGTRTTGSGLALCTYETAGPAEFGTVPGAT